MSSTPATVSLDNTFGCLTIGILLSMALWGAGSIQTYYYFDRYGSDSLYLKLQVFAVWALETTHQALVLGGIYKYLVTHYADVAYLSTVESMLRNSVIITGIIAIIVQSIFVDRIYCLSKNNLFLTGVTAILAITQLIATILYYAKIHSSTTFVEFNAQRNFMRADNLITTLANAGIAGTLICLYAKTKTGFKKNDAAVNKVLAIVVNTGVLTACCAFACFIASIASPDTFVYLLFYLVLSRLYLNSVVSSLNARSTKSSNATDSTGTPGRNFRMTNVRNNHPEVSSYAARPTAPRVVTIKVDTETILDNDPNKDMGRPESDIDESSYSNTKGTAF